MSNANPLTLARYELRRFRGTLPKLALIFVLLIPTLYGATYLAGNWDPYGRLHDLPVAIVNEDKPATANGQRVTAGDDFATSLHNKGTFKFVDASLAEAEDGLRMGRYYLVIHVPSDFSAHLVSGQTDTPQRANITLRRNDANGFVIGTITRSAQDSIARAIDEAATQSYFEAVFANLRLIRAGMVDAANGAQALADGLASADTGSKDLASGITQAKDGATKLHTGITTLETGASELADGAGKLALGATQVAGGTQTVVDVADPILDFATDHLPTAQKRLTSAVSKAAKVSAVVASDTGTANTNLADLSSAITDLKTQNPQLANSTAFQRLDTAYNKVSGAVSTVATDTATIASDLAELETRLGKIGDLSTKAATARTKLHQLNDGAQKVATGATQLETGAKQLSKGLNTAATGANSLTSGLETAETGATSLHDGITKLHEGAVKLSDGLSQGVKRIPVFSSEQSEHAAQVLSSPADVQMSIDNPAGVYGRGLAPMFFSIALWVLGISAFMVLRPITGRVLTGRASVIRLALTAWLPMGVVSVVAGWLMLAVAWLGLGLNPIHPFLMIALVSLTAVAFSLIAHFLRTALGLVATALLLVMLILQLTAAGGTYPPEMLPPLFHALSPFTPMYYTIDAFRIAISGGLMSKFLRDIAVLLAITATTLAGLVVVVRKKQLFRITDLHSPLQ